MNGNVVGLGKDDKGVINYYNVKIGIIVVIDVILLSFLIYINIVIFGELSVVLVLVDDIFGIGYFIGFVIVRVWLEGWDYDVYNNILGDILKILLFFKKVV